MEEKTVAAPDDGDDLIFVTCPSCNEEFYPEDPQQKRCDDCLYVAVQTEELMSIIERGETERLIPQLQEMRRITGEPLIDEAIYYAHKGDRDEAEFRTRLYTHPKFSSEKECREKYDEAMAEKRARASA